MRKSREQRLYERRFSAFLKVCLSKLQERLQRSSSASFSSSALFSAVIADLMVTVVSV